MPDRIALPLFVAPTFPEYTAIRKSLADFRGRIRVDACGMGQERAQRFSRGLKPEAVRTLVLLGWAGGLSPNLTTGQIIVAETALREGQPPIGCETITVHGACSGPVLTVSRALITTAEKRSAQMTGALAVEMEAYPLSAWAQDHSIPFVHARVILDPLQDDLPDIASHPTRLFSDALHLLRLIRQVEPILRRLAREIAVSLLSETQQNTGGHTP